MALNSLAGNEVGGKRSGGGEGKEHAYWVKLGVPELSNNCEPAEHQRGPKPNLALYLFLEKDQRDQWHPQNSCVLNQQCNADRQQQHCKRVGPLQHPHANDAQKN